MANYYDRLPDEEKAGREKGTWKMNKRSVRWRRQMVLTQHEAQ